MEARLNSIISAVFLSSLWTEILNVNFCKYSICSLYIVKSLSFFRCEAIFMTFPRKPIVTSLPPTRLLFIGLLPQTGFTNRFLVLCISLIVAILAVLHLCLLRYFPSKNLVNRADNCCSNSTFFISPVLLFPSIYSFYFLISLIIFFSNLLSFLFSFPITVFCLLLTDNLLLFNLFSFY